MKKVTILVFILPFLLTITSLAGTEKVTSKNNDYGGVTKETTYSENDVEYKEGMLINTTHYDSKGNVVKYEQIATLSHAVEEGVLKFTIYMKNKKRTKIEAYSTEAFASQTGYHKMVGYFDNKERLLRREYYMTKDSLPAQFGVHKSIVYYDEKGRKTKTDYVDKQGQIVMTE